MQLARRNSSFYRSSDKEVLPVCAPKQAEAKSSVCFSLGCVLGGLAVLCLLFLRAPQFFGLTASGAAAPGPNDEPVMSQARISALEAALEPARASVADWRAAADAAKATSTRGVAERAARAATTPRAAAAVVAAADASPAPIGDASCVDEGEHCGDWASQGECARNAAFMKEHCAKSCGTCATARCSDANTGCSQWAAQGECKKNPTFMRHSCKKSCGLCAAAA